MAYATDLDDDQWARVLELICETPKRGRPYPEDLRRVVDAMFYIARTGCQWRMLPATFPPWTRVWSQFRRWRTNGTWARVLAGLHRQVRIRFGREPDPSMLVADPTLVRGASHGGATFHNQGGLYGRTKGAKHTVAVDITGLPAAALAAPANVDDGAAVEGLVAANPLGSRLELLIVDRGVKTGAQRRLAADRGVEVKVVGWDARSSMPTARRCSGPSPTPGGSKWPTLSSGGTGAWRSRSRTRCRPQPPGSRSAAPRYSCATSSNRDTPSKRVYPYFLGSTGLDPPCCTHLYWGYCRRVAWSKTAGKKPLVSHTGVELTRHTSFKFALDPTCEQEQLFYMFAGARRYAFNYHIGRVKTNLATRTEQREQGVPSGELSPSLSWSAPSFINEFNAYKNGDRPNSPQAPGVKPGLHWRDLVSSDVFETASVDAATALKNFGDSLRGTRKGPKAGFPHFAQRGKGTPVFRLRSRSAPGATGDIRFPAPKTVRLPKIGVVRVHGCAKTVRRMIEQGRFHIHSATVSYSKGRWWVSVSGVAAVFHHVRRSPQGRSGEGRTGQAGLDLGVKTLAVVADTDGNLTKTWEGVKALRKAQTRLKQANKAWARTKPGSKGRLKAKQRLTRIHARISYLRTHLAHQISYELATTLKRLTIEDLNVAGMLKLRSLSRAISDAGFGDLRRMLEYKTDWYGCDLHLASRWYPSSKTCSNCGHIKDVLSLTERMYQCAVCGLSIDRDVNAAINLARWPDRTPAQPAVNQPGVQAGLLEVVPLRL